MRAWQVTQKGFKNLTLLKNAPIPQITTDHDVLIKNLAVGLNPADYKRCDRDQPPFIPTPFIIGAEGCGIIEKAGPAVDSSIYSAGKLVYYKSNSFGIGCFSDYTIQDARTVSFVPEKMLEGKNLQDIAVKFASLPVCAWTAYTNVCIKLRLPIFPIPKEYQSNPKFYKNIVVNGASGGVGSFVLQFLALWKGTLSEEMKKEVRIIGICSGKNHEYIRSLGATHAVDYNEENLVEKLLEITEKEGVDAFFDNVGGSTINWAMEVLGNGGDYLTNLAVPQGFDMSKLFFRSQNVHQTYLSNMYTHKVEHQLKELKEIGDIVGRLVEEEKLKVSEVKVIGFDEIKENLEEIGKSGSKGKIVALF